VSRHQVSPEPEAVPAADQCNNSQATPRSCSIIEAKHSKFTDEHFKLMVAVSDLVKESQKDFTQDLLRAQGDEGQDTNRGKAKADQSSTLLTILTHTCKKMAHQVTALSQKMQKEKENTRQLENGPETECIQKQSASSTPSGGSGKYKSGGLHNITANDMDKLASVSGSTSATQSGEIAMTSPILSRCRSAQCFQPILPAETDTVLVPKQSKWCRNPLRVLGGALQRTTHKRQMSVPHASTEVDTMNLQEPTSGSQAVRSCCCPQDEHMMAFTLPNVHVPDDNTLSENVVA